MTGRPNDASWLSSNLREIQERGLDVLVSAGLNGAGVLAVAVAPAHELPVVALGNGLDDHRVVGRGLHGVTGNELTVLLDGDAAAAVRAHSSLDGEVTRGGRGGRLRAAVTSVIAAEVGLVVGASDYAASLEADVDGLLVVAIDNLHLSEVLVDGGALGHEVAANGAVAVLAADEGDEALVEGLILCAGADGADAAVEDGDTLRQGMELVLGGNHLLALLVVADGVAQRHGNGLAGDGGLLGVGVARLVGSAAHTAGEPHRSYYCHMLRSDYLYIARFCCVLCEST